MSATAFETFVNNELPLRPAIDALPADGELTAGKILIATGVGMLVEQGDVSSLPISGTTASRLLATDASNLPVSTDLIDWVASTANRVIAITDGAGGITLSCPQDIAITSDVRFGTLGLGMAANGTINVQTLRGSDGQVYKAYGSTNSSGTFLGMDVYHATERVAIYAYQGGHKLLYLGHATDASKAITIDGATGYTTFGDKATFTDGKYIYWGSTYIGDTGSGFRVYTVTNEPFTVYGNSTGATGPQFKFFHDSASPAASDIVGKIFFNGRDSAGNEQTYGAIKTAIAIPVTTAESGTMTFSVVYNGSEVDCFAMEAGFFTAKRNIVLGTKYISTTGLDEGISVGASGDVHMTHDLDIDVDLNVDGEAVIDGAVLLGSTLGVSGYTEITTTTAATALQVEVGDTQDRLSAVRIVQVSGGAYDVAMEFSTYLAQAHWGLEGNSKELSMWEGESGSQNRVVALTQDGDIKITNGRYIGTFGDPDAIAIAAGGDVTLTQKLGIGRAATVQLDVYNGSGSSVLEVEAAGAGNDARIRMDVPVSAGSYGILEWYKAGAVKAQIYLDDNADDILKIWNGADAVEIDASQNTKFNGNVGIGRAPTVQLDVYKAADNVYLKFETDGSAKEVGADFYAEDTRLFIKAHGSTFGGSFFGETRADAVMIGAAAASVFAVGTYDAAPFHLKTNSTTAITIGTSQNVGIGVTSHATTKLSVEKSAGSYTGTNIAAIFGDVDSSANTYIIGNTINAGFGYNADYDLWVNYRGYNGGTTQFRNFKISNGKGGAIAIFDGSDNTLQVANLAGVGNRAVMADSNGILYCA